MSAEEKSLSDDGGMRAVFGFLERVESPLVSSVELRPSVVHRKGLLTAEDYEEAIGMLRDAMGQLEPDGKCCAVCGDDHMPWDCHHNPLVMGRRGVETAVVWRCYHCGDVFRTPEAAEKHFGKAGERAEPLCRTVDGTHGSNVAWMAEVRRMARLLGWSATAIESIDEDAWLEYFKDGHTPAQAWEEEYDAASR